MIIPDTDTINSALRQVIDPELDCNIVDLGLVYGITNGQGNVTVKMTLTTPGCPMHDSIVGGVEAVVQNLEGVDSVQVDLVWEPPWHPNLMTPAGRRKVGLE